MKDYKAIFQRLITNVELSPAIPQITWTLVNDEGRKINYQHFTIPYILTVDEAKKKTLTYLLSGLKAKGIIYADGRKWKAVKKKI